MIGVAEDTLDYAQRKAVTYYRETEARQQKEAAFKDALERAKAAADQAALDKRAAEVVGLDRR